MKGRRKEGRKNRGTKECRKKKKENIWKRNTTEKEDKEK